MSEQLPNDDFPTERYKRPRKDTTVRKEGLTQKEESYFRHRVLQPWVQSSQEEETESQSEQEETSLQDQLKKQLLQQRLMGDKLRVLCRQLTSLQAGHGLHPLFQQGL